jgi:hypothetical protein
MTGTGGLQRIAIDAVLVYHVMGASLKGMGAAGISIDDELRRSAELIAEARKEGNSDGRFTTISKAKNIPMIVVEKNFDLVTELGKLFGKS